MRTRFADRDGKRSVMTKILANKLSCFSVEELDETQHKLGWPTEYNQLDPGAFSATIATLEESHWFLLNEQSAQTVEVRAPAPSGKYIIALAEGAPGAVNGRLITDGHALLVPPDADFRATLTGGMSVLEVGVDTEIFDQVVHAVAPDLSLEGAGVQSFAVDSHISASLRKAMRAALFTPANRAAAREEQVVEIVTATLRAALDRDEAPSSHFLHTPTARQTLAKAMEYIEAHLHETLRIAALANELGVTIRSLERIFKREVGMSPQNYVKVRRLNAAYRSLRNADQAHVPRVGDVAARHGFRHKGRFSVDFHRHFAEYPQQVLHGR